MDFSCSSSLAWLVLSQDLPPGAKLGFAVVEHATLERFERSRSWGKLAHLSPQTLSTHPRLSFHPMRDGQTGLLEKILTPPAR